MSYLHTIKEKFLSLRTRWQNHQARCAFRRYLRSGCGRKFYIIGAPQYANLGDSAIDLAQRHFLQTAGAAGENIKEITKEEYGRFRDVIRTSVQPRDAITCIGGGNMGDEWLAEEIFRRQVIADFPDRPVAVFPQTLYYTPTEKGRSEQEASRAVYNRETCILAARERTSYGSMQQLYPRARIYLTPDIVLSMTAQDFGVTAQKREGILLVLRRDVEASLQEQDRLALRAAAEALKLPVEQTDMYAAEPVTRENRARLVQAKMQQFAAARLVVTDRLHGMVFAAITRTPCVVLGNYNHKVEGTFAWLKDLSYIRFAGDVQQAKQLLPVLLETVPGDFPADAMAQAFSAFHAAVETL